MTNTELNHAAATRVMGWRLHEGRYLNGDGHTVMLTDEWNPCEDWRHAGMILERLDDLGWGLRMYSNCTARELPRKITETSLDYQPRYIGDAASDPHEM